MWGLLPEGRRAIAFRNKKSLPVFNGCSANTRLIALRKGPTCYVVYVRFAVCSRPTELWDVVSELTVRPGGWLGRRT
jgi:hypothetical protein